MTLYNYNDYWDERTKRPADIFSLEKQKDISSILKNLDFKTVLELGCGDGEFSKLLKGFNCKLFGIDISNRIYKNNFIDIGFKQNFIDWSFQHQYDLVCCSHFLLHIKPEHIKQVIENIKSISKKHILFIEPHCLQDLGKWEYDNFPYNYDKLMKKKSKFTQIDKSTGAYLYD